jgi:hypothetical protein
MPQTISNEALVTVAGGMKWEQFRRSTNIEDRRTPAAIKRDQEYWNKSFGGTTQPR